MMTAPSMVQETTKGQAICPYCGVGCRLLMESACGELLRPMRWADALGWTAARFREIIDRHGPDAVAFYGSGQLDSEASYLAVKLFKGSMGTNNTDSNSRLCMASAVTGYQTSFGADGPPCCYADIDLSDCLVVWGSNMADAFPVTFNRMKAHLKAKPGVELIVVDPRRTDTAKHATLYVPVAPGGDIPLMNAVGRLLLERGAVDHDFVAAHTEGFGAYRDFLLHTDWEAMVSAAGVPEAPIRALADRLARSRALLTFYCQGLNQSTVGMWKNNSIINLHLLTGQIGKPGAGPFSLTGQPNAMGGREAGLLAQALPGYRFSEDPGHRAEVEAYWGRPAGTVSTRPGLTAVEMSRALEAGRLKAIWIAATNPAVSLPDLHQVRRALSKAELIVVQDPYHPTETTQFADVLLPVAQWAEKTGTMTSSERLVSFSEQVVNPPGMALPDWQILARFGQAMGFSGFEFEDSGAVWDELIGLTAGRPCDMAGVTSERLRRERHLRWPCPSVDHPGTERLYLDRRFATPSGRARFHARPHRPPRETTDHEFPLVAQAAPARAVGVRRSPPRRRGRGRPGRGAVGRVEQPSRPDPPPGQDQPEIVAGRPLRPVPLGRPAERERGGELLDDRGDRPDRQAARVQVLRRPASPGPRRAGARAGLRADDAAGRAAQGGRRRCFATPGA